VARRPAPTSVRDRSDCSDNRRAHVVTTARAKPNGLASNAVGVSAGAGRPADSDACASAEDGLCRVRRRLLRPISRISPLTVGRLLRRFDGGGHGDRGDIRIASDEDSDVAHRVPVRVGAEAALHRHLRDSVRGAARPPFGEPKGPAPAPGAPGMCSRPAACVGRAGFDGCLRPRPGAEIAMAPKWSSRFGCSALGGLLGRRKKPPAVPTPTACFGADARVVTRGAQTRSSRGPGERPQHVVRALLALATGGGLESPIRGQGLILPACGATRAVARETTRSSSVASRGGTPDLTTAIRAVAKSRVDAFRVKGGAHNQERTANGILRDAAQEIRSGYQTGTSAPARPHPRCRPRSRIARDRGRSLPPRCPPHPWDVGSHPGGREFESR
jgi:hypothetical protein